MFDEIALYSTVLGTEAQQREFVALFRDLVARGRAAGILVIAATQRPSVDIIPKSVRDLFGYRAAFRCTSTGSSNIILGDGWSEAGFDATEIRPTNPGVAYLIAEGGVPQRIRAAWLTDANITGLADYAAWTRRTGTPAALATMRRTPMSPEPWKEHPCCTPPSPPPGPSPSPGFVDLADYLATHPCVPVPTIGANITVYVGATEDGGQGQVAHIAAQLGAPVTDDTRSGWYPTATRMFGLVGYMALSIPATVMADHYAHDSYYGPSPRSCHDHRTAHRPCPGRRLRPLLRPACPGHRHEPGRAMAGHHIHRPVGIQHFP